MRTYVLIVRETQGNVHSEQGGGKVDGDKVSLTGNWSGKSDKYDASYSGAFVRLQRQPFTGTPRPTWQHDGKSFHAQMHWRDQAAVRGVSAEGW